MCSADGPSWESLLPGDRILNINGEDVQESPRNHVIQLVKWDNSPSTGSSCWSIKLTI